MDSIITKEALYYVFYDHGDEVMRIIKNPNNKDVQDWKDSKEAS